MTITLLCNEKRLTEKKKRKAPRCSGPSRRSRQFSTRQRTISFSTVVRAVFVVTLLLQHPLLTSSVASTQAVAPWASERIFGLDRYETAAQVSKRFFPSSVESIVVATGEGFADSLAGSAAAARLFGPLLLVRRTAVPDSTAAEIARLGPKNIYVLGGPAAIADDVLKSIQLISNANVVRLWGNDRYETAVAISRALFSSNVSSVHIIGGQTFGEGLASGAMAGSERVPVLLSSGASLRDDVLRELTRLQPTRIIVTTGRTSFDVLVKNQINFILPNSEIVWIGGFATNDYIAQEASGSIVMVGYKEGLFRSPSAIVVNGDNFPDGLAAGAAAAAIRAPLVLVKKECMTEGARYELAMARVTKVITVGGPAAVDDRASLGLLCYSTYPQP